MQKESYADVISGREIIQKALRIGLLSREEARDRKVRDAAESIAHSVNDFHEEGHGFGSSDMNYAVKDMLNLAGLKADWVNGRLTRLASTSRAASDRMWSLHAALDTTDTALRGFILGELGFNQNKIAEAAPKQDKAKKKERDIPKNVKRYVEETKKQAPDKDPSYWWSVAWSRYCKYKKPGSPHCKMDTGEYFPGTGKKAEEAIPGGLARGKKPSDFDQKQLEMGIEVEKEHLVGDGYSEKEMHDKAQEIAMDHLFEIPDYYTRLQKMEGEAEMGKKAEKSEQTKCMDKYKDPDGTFLGPNDGTAWDNCIKAFKECRKDVDDPEAMCGYIRSRKAATILKSASSAKVAAQAMFKYTRHKGGSAEEALIAADYAVAVWNQKSAAGTLSRALDSLHGQLDGLMYNIPEGDEYEPLVKDMAAVRDHLAKIMSKHSRMLQSIKEK